MRKRNLILPFFVGSLFIPSLESIKSATFSNLYEKENITFQAVDAIPLASSSSTGGGGSGGGGGGGRKSKQQQKNLQKNKERAKEAAKKRKEAKESKDAELKESKDAELKEKIAISKIDDVGPSNTDGIKDKVKELTAKLSIASITRISSKIEKLEDEFKNYNAQSIDDRLKKFDEINSKIEALEDLQDKIDDFLNFNIDNVVFILGIWDQLENPVITMPEVAKKDEEFKKKYESLVEELKAADIYIKDYYNVARELSKNYALTGNLPTKEEKKAAGIDNDELESSLLDLYLFTVRNYRLVAVWGSKNGLTNKN